SSTLAWATIFGVGHFGDDRLPFYDRVLQAQAAILTVVLFALVLAALFAERKDNEERLVGSNMLLERERNNKLMSLAATVATISHEMRQPLTAIMANGSAALHLLAPVPPDVEEARSALSDIISGAQRADKVLDDFRILYGKAESELEPVDVNEVSLKAL